MIKSSIAPFIQEILEFYEIVAHQLTPNSYKMAICMYLIYDQELYTTLSALELGYFYKLKETGKKGGCFYLAAWTCHDSKCIKGTKERMSGWHEHFLYCYDCPNYRKYFNIAPR